MSSLITLRLPFFDFECLEKAIEKSGLKIIQKTKDILLSNGILFQNTNIGYIAQVNNVQKEIINAIQTEYEKFYQEKVKALREAQRKLEYLEDQLKMKIKKINKLKQNFSEKNQEKIQKTVLEIESLQSIKQIQEEIKRKEQMKLKELEESNKKKITHIVEKIQSQAQKRKYRVKISKIGDKTQLILVKQRY
ncbi:MAG: hypothetical protein K9W44_14930 [Candidatus Lokiarchaeota archaeon]|nr:hypothetical protein [Candidatus Harpocratesius repetitus]